MARSVLLVGFTVLAACDDPTNGPAEELPFPEGVELVEVTSAQLEDIPRWSFSRQPVVSIGRTVGEEEYLFFRVNAARRLDSGEIGRFRTLDSIGGSTTVSVGLAADYFSGAALFEPGGAVDVGSTGLVLGDPHEFEIRMWDGRGTLRRVIRVRVPPTPVTDDLLDRYRSWADTASGLPAATHQYLASLEPAGAVPFFGGLFLDRAERIWVQDYRPFWAFGPRGPAAWTVFGSDGEPLARIEGGAPGSILEAGEDYVLVRATDELGVEQVRMYAIERPPAAQDVPGS